MKNHVQKEAAERHLSTGLTRILPGALRRPLRFVPGGANRNGSDRFGSAVSEFGSYNQEGGAGDSPSDAWNAFGSGIGGPENWTSGVAGPQDPETTLSGLGDVFGYEDPQQFEQDEHHHSGPVHSSSYGETQILNAKLAGLGGAAGGGGSVVGGGGWTIDLEREAAGHLADMFRQRADDLWRGMQRDINQISPSAAGDTRRWIGVPESMREWMIMSKMDESERRIKEKWDNLYRMLHAGMPNPEGDYSRPGAPTSRRARRTLLQQVAEQLNKFAPRVESLQHSGGRSRGGARNWADAGSLHPREGGWSAPTGAIPYIRQMGDPGPEYFAHGLESR